MEMENKLKCQVRGNIWEGSYLLSKLYYIHKYWEKKQKKKMVNSYSTPKMIIDKTVPLHDLMMIIGLQ